MTTIAETIEVSRRLSIVVGFYRVCVIDQILPHSPADYVRRPTVPAESPTLGPGPPAVRSPDHHGEAVCQPERLRPSVTAGPTRWVTGDPQDRAASAAASASAV
ncbi:hypothetical protein K1W54_14355 [Micromonospora sp. CPCC 205371]|nr:hypothetical protein [Micromonospora sp. CPCC 205371]